MYRIDGPFIDIQLFITRNNALRELVSVNAEALMNRELVEVWMP